jgi:hypothetical protein
VLASVECTVERSKKRCVERDADSDGCDADTTTTELFTAEDTAGDGAEDVAEDGEVVNCDAGVPVGLHSG